MTDLIRRADAIAACQVGPSDEWSRSTKSGYSQAATDCAMNVLKIHPVAPPAVSDDVAALVEASEIMAAALGALNAQAHRTMTGGYGHLIDDAAHALRDYRAALAKLKGGVK